MGTRPFRDLVFVPGQLLGVVVPFVPFSGVSVSVPIHVLWIWHGTPWTILSIVTLAFLCVPILILASTIRQAIWGPLGRGEAWVAYGVSLAALVAMAFFLLAEQGNFHPSLIGSALIWAIGAIAILASTTNSRVPRAVHAHVALLVAYLSSVGFFCIISFGWMPSQIGPGCWLATVAILAYSVEAIIRVRRALRDEGGPVPLSGE